MESGGGGETVGIGSRRAQHHAAAHAIAGGPQLATGHIAAAIEIGEEGGSIPGGAGNIGAGKEMGEGPAHIASGKHRLGVQRRIGPGPPEHVGQQHQIAAIGQPLRHVEQIGPDGQPIHIEDHRRPGALAPTIRREHMGRALPLGHGDGELLVHRVRRPS